MASAGGIRAGRAFVELFADDRRLVRGLRAAQRRLRAFGAGVRSIGTKMFAAGSLVVGPLSLAVKAASDMEETMNKFNVVFGDNAKNVKTWGDSFAGQVGRSKKQVADFLSGTQDLLVPIGFDSRMATEMSKQLTGLAIDLASFNNKADADVMRDLHAALTGSSEVMKKYGVIVNQTAVKQELLNRGFDPNNVTEQQKVMARMAIILRGTTAAQGDAVRSAGSFANRMKALKAKTADAAVEIGSSLLPVITPLITRLAKGVRVVADWIKQNKGLVVSIAKIAAIVLGVGATFILVGGAISGFGAILGMLAGIVSAVGTAIGILGAMIAALMTPIGIVIAGVTALGAYLITATDSGGQAVGWLGKKFNSLKDTALAAWKGIGDALAAGDLGLAAKILWLTLKILWKKGVNALNQIWVKVKEFFMSAWTEAVFGAAKIATNAWAALQTAWIETVDFLRDAWVTFTTFIARNWNKVVGFFKSAWQKLKAAVTGKDTSRVQRQIEQETRRRNAQLNRERDRAIYQREQKRRKRLGEIERGRSGVIDELERQKQAEHKARQDRFAGDLQKSEDALAEARKEWQGAIEEAARKREAVEAEGDDDGPARLKKPGELMKDFKNQISGANKRLKDAKLSVTGTFNAAAVRGLAGGTPEQRTAKATEQTAKNTKKLLQEAKLGKPAFT